MTVSMKARQAFPYAGKRLKAGQEFQARGESDARVLAAIGHAERVVAPAIVAPAPRPPAGGTYRTRAIISAPVQVVMRAEPPAAPAATAQTIEAEPAAEPIAGPVADAASVPGLDSLDRDAWHELAERRGVKVHHLAGAAKVRAAILEAAAE